MQISNSSKKKVDKVLMVVQVVVYNSTYKKPQVSKAQNIIKDIYNRIKHARVLKAKHGSI